MANNRMYLRCKACGKEIFIGKRLTNGYWIEQYPDWKKQFMDLLNDFYDEHTYCNGEGEDCFEIHYEDTPEYSFTNADKIRAMDDEEMAEWMAGYFYNAPPINREYLIKSLLAWLEKEVEND